MPGGARRVNSRFGSPRRASAGSLSRPEGNRVFPGFHEFASRIKSAESA